MQRLKPISDSANQRIFRRVKPELIKTKFFQIDDAGIQFCSDPRRDELSFNDSFTKRNQLWNAIRKLQWDSENFAKPGGHETKPTGNVPVFAERNSTTVGFVVFHGRRVRMRNKNVDSNLKINSACTAGDA